MQTTPSLTTTTVSAQTTTRPPTRATSKARAVLCATLACTLVLGVALSGCSGKKGRASDNGYLPASQSLHLVMEGVSCYFEPVDEGKSPVIDTGTFKKLLINGKEIQVVSMSIEKGGYILTKDFGKIMVKPSGNFSDGSLQLFLKPEQEKMLADYGKGE